MRKVSKTFIPDSDWTSKLALLVRGYFLSCCEKNTTVD
jgi:hypothetical protein